MASAARAYSPQRAPRRTTSIKVVPGRSSGSLAPSFVLAVKIFMAVVALFALVACVRIGLANATVTTSMQTETINAQVEQMRSGSAHLEVTEATLGNPAQVKVTASKELHMGAPAETTVIALGDDVVAFDELGNLSLSRSLAPSQR